MSRHDTKYKHVEPFDIDHGELDGITADQAFVLGVEWQIFRTTLSSTRERFKATVHAANEQRLLRLLARRGRKGAARRLDATWTEIEVAPELLN